MSCLSRSPTFADLAALAERCGLAVRADETRELLPGGGWSEPVQILWVEGATGSEMVRANGLGDANALRLALRWLLPGLQHWQSDPAAVRDLAAVLSEEAPA